MWIYENDNIFIILANKIKDIKEYNFLSKYNVIDLTDNRFVNNIFQHGLSKFRESFEYDEFTFY